VTPWLAPSAALGVSTAATVCHRLSATRDLPVMRAFDEPKVSNVSLWILELIAIQREESTPRWGALGRGGPDRSQS